MRGPSLALGLALAAIPFGCVCTGPETWSSSDVAGGIHFATGSVAVIWPESVDCHFNVVTPWIPGSRTTYLSNGCTLTPFAQVSSFSVDDPSLFAQRAYDPSEKLMTFAVLDAGDTWFNAEGSGPRVRQTLHATRATSAELTPLCNAPGYIGNQAADGGRLYLAAGTVVDFQIGLSSGQDYLYGCDLSVDAGSWAWVHPQVSFCASNPGDPGNALADGPNPVPEALVPDMPSDTEISVALVPGFAQPVSSYVLSEVDGLAFEFPWATDIFRGDPVQVGGTLQTEVAYTIGGALVCTQVWSPASATSLTPGVCLLGTPSNPAQTLALPDAGFDVIGVAPGPCQIRVSIDTGNDAGGVNTLVDLTVVPCTSCDAGAADGGADSGSPGALDGGDAG